MDSAYQLAQINITRMKFPLDDPRMADFVAALDEVNALADRSPGFIWRLQSPAGNSTAIRAFDDPLMLVNISVWENMALLKEYTYKGMHGRIFARRQTWFDKIDGVQLAAWWAPRGTIPTIEEGKARLNTLALLGETTDAFTFKNPFPAPDEK